MAAAQGLIVNSFIVINADTIYGDEAIGKNYFLINFDEFLITWKLMNASFHA